MENPNSYYKFVYHMFNKTYNWVQASTNKNLELDYQTDADNLESWSIEILYEWNRDILKNKREAKLLHKIQMEIMNIYVDKMKHISNNKAKSYSIIVSKFMHYSSSIDPNNLDKFIHINFNSPKQGCVRSPKLKVTAF